MGLRPFKQHASYLELREIFVVDYPRIGEIRKRYENRDNYRVKDLNKETKLSRKDVAEAIKEAANNDVLLYIPEDFPPWESTVYKKRGKVYDEDVEIEIKSSGKYKDPTFKQFGPEVTLTHLI